ncbi:hypothetical protein [Enterobacter cloacae complex sp. 288G10]|uniref:hypothetical protein n=1 Tax=Enterobacter cloacae complex sp. 288G10 TaxID=3395859 RepID=UPI003CEFCC20
MSLTLPLMYFKTGSDLSQITHYEVNYPDDFVKQAWEQPEINLFIVCVNKERRGSGDQGRHGRIY